MAELFLLTLVISSAAFLEIPSTSNFSQKLSMPEVLVFLSLSMNAFPSLSLFKNSRLVESKSVFLLTSEENIDTKTKVKVKVCQVKVTSKIWAWSAWTFLSTLPIRLKELEKQPLLVFPWLYNCIPPLAESIQFSENIKRNLVGD